ncbi:MAG: HAD-IIA family hydrolase [Rhodospirillaceae bacterium]|nr:HAD-IIA family hydrolase [Rhodospirillaceae bacterium]
MDIRILSGLAEIADDYDLFILDLWGVVHDGEAVFPGAVDCLQRLRRRDAHVVLLSNAAIPSAPLAEHQAKIGVTDDLYDWMLSSGEITANAIAADAFCSGGSGGSGDSGGSGGSGVNARPTCFFIGSELHRITLEACGARETDIERAEFILCAGLVDNKTEQPEDYRGILRKGVDRGLTLVCANPDVVANHGERLLPGAGALAALYEEMGGTVQQFGKPFSPIYDRLFDEYLDIPRTRAVMIGDALPTDIRGARHAGIDAVWIGGGIHADALAMGPKGDLQPNMVHALAEQAGERPNAILPWLIW